MYSIRQVSRKLQNFASTNTDLENHVRELTNTDLWGPSTQQLYELNMIILSSISYESYKITKPPLRIDDLPKSEHISNSSKIIFHLFNRIFQYSNIPTRYLSFNKLRLHLNNEKPPLFENYGSHKIYESIKKNYINQGLEYRIISKSLACLEYLLINCFSEEYDIKLEIASYKQYIDQISKKYVCNQALDHKMKFHTDSVRSKCQTILSLLDNEQELLSKRKTIHKVSDKINSQTTTRQSMTGFRTRPGRSFSWTRYNGVDKLGLKLDEDYNDEPQNEAAVNYNDQDLSGYYDDDENYNDQDLSHVYDEMGDDDYLRENLKEEKEEEEEEFGELQKADNGDDISNEFNLLDLNFNNELPVSPSSLPKNNFNDLLEFNDPPTRESYILHNSQVSHVPKTSSSVLPENITSSDKKMSVFDDLFIQGKQKANNK